MADRPVHALDFGREVTRDLAVGDSREWLCTNGIGSFASGTVAGPLTRRYHGLLVAALTPPVDRTVLVTKFDEIVEYAGTHTALAANRWADGTVAPEGYQHIESFRLDGTTPVWTYAAADALIEKRVWMEQGQNTTYVRYEVLRATGPLTLRLEAFVNYRDYHSTTHAEGWRMEVAPAEAGLRVTAFPGARPVMVAGDPEWSLKASVKDLERMLPGATGVILCSPCNPTGAVYTHAEIRAIAQWAKARNAWVVADEIYRRIHYGTGPAPSFLDLPDDLLERVVLISGVSKTYAMTGWRIGFALAPAKVAKAMAALQSHTTTGANHPAQFAAAAALGDERVEQDVNRMVAEFRKRRDLVVSRFRQDLPGVEFVDPLGAFYFFFRVDSFGRITGTDFCTRLITQTGVALVPGAAFGDDRWVRLSYAAATDAIKQALDRIVGFARKLGD